MDQTDRQARWVAMWREAVRSSGRPIGLVDLSAMRFLELSDSAAELLGTTPGHGAGLDYLSVTERPAVATEMPSALPATTPASSASGTLPIPTIVSAAA